MFKKKLKRMVAWILLVAMIVSNNSFTIFAEEMQESIQEETDNKYLGKYYEEYKEEYLATNDKNKNELSSIDDNITFDEEETISPENVEEEENEIEPEIEIETDPDDNNDNFNNKENEEPIEEIEAENNLEENEEEFDIVETKNEEETKDEIDIATKSEKIEMEESEKEENEESEENDEEIATESEIEQEDVSSLSEINEEEIKTVDDINEFLKNNKKGIEDVSFEKHLHKLCGTSINELCRHTADTARHTTIVEFTPWDGETEISNGTYYLSKDIDYNKNIVVDRYLIICLNGHNFNMNNNKIIGEKESTFVYLVDCSDVSEVEVICTSEDEALFEKITVMAYKITGKIIFKAGLLINQEGVDYQCHTMLENTILDVYKNENSKMNKSKKVGARSEHFALPPEYQTTEYWYMRLTGLFKLESSETVWANFNSGYVYLTEGCPVFSGKIIARGIRSIYGTVFFNNLRETDVSVWDFDENGDMIEVTTHYSPEIKSMAFENCVSERRPVFTISSSSVWLVGDDISFDNCTGEGSIFAVENGSQIRMTTGAGIKIKNCTVTDNGYLSNLPAAFYAGQKENSFESQKAIELSNGEIEITDNKIITNKSELIGAGMYLDGNMILGTGYMKISGNTASKTNGAQNDKIYCHQLLLEELQSLSFRGGTYNLRQTDIEIAIRKGNHSGPVAENFVASRILNHTTVTTEIEQYIKPDKYYNSKFDIYVGFQYSADLMGDVQTLFIGVLPEKAEYTIRYNKGTIPLGSDGNDYSDGVMGECPDQKIVGYQIATLSAGYTLSGYTQIGWATQSGATEKEYELYQEVIKLTENDGEIVTLYAVWKETSYYLTFEDQESVNEEGEVVNNTQYIEAKYFETVQLSNYTFSHKGVELEAWILTYSTDITVATGSIYPLTAVITQLSEQNGAQFEFTPKVKKSNYEIVFNPNFPYRENDPYITSGSMPNQICQYNTFHYLNPNKFTVEGFNFLGWSTVQIAVITQESGEDESSEQPSVIAYEDEGRIVNLAEPLGVVELFAVWGETSYSIYFSGNKPISEMEPVTYNSIGFTTIVTAPPEEAFSYDEQIVSSYKFSRVVVAAFNIEDSFTEEQLAPFRKEDGSLNIDEYGNLILRENIDYRVYKKILTPGQTYDGLVAMINKDFKNSIYTAYYTASYTIATFTANFHANPPKDVNGKYYETDITMDSVIIDTKNDPYINSPAYSFDNYKFLYWLVDSTSSTATKVIDTGNGYYVGDLSPQNNKTSIDFYAAWEPNKYVVKYRKGNTNVPDTPTMSDETKEYDKKYKIGLSTTNRFAYENHTLRYFVIDEIKDANEQPLSLPTAKMYYPNLTEYSNLTNVDKATVYFKAVWDGPNAGYRVVFDNNIPQGITNTVTGSMNELEFTGSESKVITGNLQLSGYSLLGFGFKNNDVTPTYKLGDSIFGLGSNGETIILYAIWRKNGGYINFDPGHNAMDGAAPDMMFIDPERTQNLIPHPVYDYNKGGFNFSHYIILSMQDGEGNTIPEEQFTEDELMKKIYPDEDAASLIRGNGYIVTLQMVYDEKYEVVYLAEDIVAQNGVIHEVTPKSESQIIKINDRDKLVGPSYMITNGGYSFSGNFVSEKDGTVYTTGQTVKSLCSEPGEKYELKAQFKNSVYYVDFVPGGPVAESGNSGVMNTMAKTAVRNYNVEYTLTNLYTWTGHTVEYFVIEKITAKDGTDIPVGKDVQQKITNRYINLTGEDEATVTLRPVWRGFTYNLIYDANAPSGTEVTGTVEGKTNINNYENIIIAENSFVIEGYTFLGWDKNKNAEVATYQPNDEVYALSNGIETVVYLYAIWEKRIGTVKYNLGYNPINTEVMEDQDTSVEPYVKEPKERYNRDSAEFLYYKILEIENKDGEKYELTKEEKITIVHPGDEASYLFRKKGDVLTLVKIYRVSYTVVFHASAKVDSTGKVHDVLVPASGMYEIQININDTTIVPEYTFEMDAYNFIGLYRHQTNDALEFKKGDVIGNLTETPYETIILEAQFEPAEYKIGYEKGLSVVTGELMSDTNAQYDEDVRLRDITYTYPNHHAVYWIKDRIEYEDGTSYIYKMTQKATYSIPQVGEASTIVRNLSTTSNSRVVLRAIWEADLETDDSTTYRVIFDPNLPKGYTLKNPLATMPEIYIRGGESKTVPKNVWEANGLKFKGWTMQSAISKEIDFVEGDLLYGLMTRERQVIVLYAIWGSVDGSANINPGHNPQNGDTTKNYTIDENLYVPVPEYMENANVPSSEFLYYIIDNITDQDGNKYDLTDDEKLLKIDPMNEDVAFGSLIRNEGDTVNLIKIYNEPYMVRFAADSITDRTNIVWDATPEAYVQYLHVNDRERLGIDKEENIDVDFKWDGAYIFNNEFDYNGGIYEKGTIVEKLAIQRDAQVNFKARKTPIKYNITFDPGTETVLDANAMGGMINIQYDANTPLINNEFRTRDSYTIDCFIITKVTKDGEEIKSDRIGERIENNSYTYNLTFVDGAVVTLKAMWKELVYYIAFDPNVPTGYMLSENIKMATMSFAGAEKKQLTKNEYKIKGLTFLGWATSSESKEIAFKEEAEIMGMGKENGDLFTLYAVWGFTSGNMKFDLGHEPRLNETMPDIEISPSEDTVVPDPNATTNRNNDEFLYYIIKNIKPKDSETPYELTDEEKLAKIYPGDTAGTLLRNEGDTIELLKIYKEPYTLLLQGGKKTDLDNNELIGTPTEIKQTLYVNDRERFGYDEEEGITDVKFSMPAYNFDKTFTDGNRNYKIYNDIVEKLVPQKGMTYSVVANYYPNEYFIKYDKGTNDLTETGESVVKYQMIDPNPKKYDEAYVAPTNVYSWTGHNPLYYVVDGVIKPDNTMVPEKEFKRRKIGQNTNYYNLTNIASATVVLKVVWSETTYDVRFNPNVPAGAQLSEESKTLNNLTIKDGNSFYMPDGDEYYIVHGFSFKGWNTDPTSQEVMYDAGEEMYGLAKNEKDTVIDFYAVWEKKGGIIEFDLGHNPKPEEVAPAAIDTAESEETLIPMPNELANADERPFLYYIIKQIVPYGGTSDNAYELTDEEKLLKIDPNTEGVEASTLLRDNGDTVTLIKIYEEPYDIIMLGSQMTDSEGTVHIASPDRCVQTTYVNDRVRLIDPKFDMKRGYRFNKKFTKQGVNNVIGYEVGQIVEKLVPENGGTYVPGLNYSMTATYDPIEYYVVYDSGNSDFSPEEQSRMSNVKGKYKYDIAQAPEVIRYRWTNHPIDYWVVDKIELEDGTKLKSNEYKRKKVMPAPAQFKNLINIASATVTLKAVWRNNPYTIYFNPNVPEGSTLVGKKEMEPQRISNNDGVALNKNEYEIKGKSFDGWSLDPNSRDNMFSDEEVIYGLATKENDEIDLYAMWSDKSGIIEFDLGHNPIGTETMDPIETKDVPKVPNPPEMNNADGRAFLYYIIEEIKPEKTEDGEDPEPYQLTDEEKLIKIDPKNNVDTNSLIRNNGDTVKLLKIYEEPYTVVLKGGDVKDIISVNSAFQPQYSEEARYGSPSEILQTIYINDRQRIITPSYILRGYNFSNKFKTEDNIIFTTGQIVEKLAANIGDRYEMSAQYDPIEYDIKYEKGNTAITNTMADTTKVQFNTVKRLAYNSFQYPEHTFLEYVQERIEYPNGEIKYMKNSERTVFTSRQGVYNLTDQEGAKVVLKAVWSDVEYQFRFNANVPSGYKLNSKSIDMQNQKFVGNEKKKIASNSYAIDGLSFKGWATYSTATEEFIKDGEVVYDMANKNNDIIDLYAVWYHTKGTVVFDSGHNPKPGDSMEPIDTEKNADAIIPMPPTQFRENQTEAPFLYYIIDNIESKDGTKYELTDDELLMKIDPFAEEDVVASSLMKADGDKVTLMKIYEEPYNLNKLGGEKVIDGVYVYGKNKEGETIDTQKIYVNDREKIEPSYFTLADGFSFNDTFTYYGESEDIIYKIGQIVRGLSDVEGGDYNITANYDEVSYTIKLLGGSDKIINQKEVNTTTDYFTNVSVDGENAKVLYNQDPAPMINRNPFNYNNDSTKQIEYFVLEKIVTKEGVEYKNKQIDRKKVYLNQPFNNLTTISEATVYLKAVWTDLVYYIAYDENLPEGFSLTDEAAQKELMKQTKVTGGETVKLASNSYVANGLTFNGWNIVSATDSILYKDGERVFALANAEEEVITLYAIWTKKTGSVQFDLGHLPRSDDRQDEIFADSNDDRIPSPNRLSNSQNDPFLYYIIKEIKPKATDENPNPKPYDLTEDELLMKIDPVVKDTRVASLLREDGDTVTLIKIYDEPYDLVLKGGQETDLNGNIIYGSPSEIIQKIYVNDRQRIASTSYTLDGYKFADMFVDNNNKQYKTGEIVEKLASNKGDKVGMTAEYKPNEYYLAFESSIPVTNPDAMNPPTLPTPVAQYNVSRTVPMNAYNATGRTFAYWVQEGVTKKNGEKLGYKDFIRTVITNGGSFINLTDHDEATVTLKAIWNGVRYTVRFNSNFPEGAVVENPDDTIEPIQIVCNSILNNEQKDVPDSIWNITDYYFDGWATQSNADESEFKVGDKIYGMPYGYGDGYELNLYAIWKNSRGIVKYDPGHNSSEHIEEQDVSENIKIPAELQNNTGDPFLYYIIKEIRPKDGSADDAYDLTDEEKLLKVYPGDNLKDYMRENGDEITLLKIYNEPYTVVYIGNTDEAGNPRPFSVEPTVSYTQQIYVNDRARLSTTSVYKTNAGHKFNNQYVSSDNKKYVLGEIVEKLVGAKGGIYNLYAQYDPVYYYIKYDPGNINVSNPTVMDADRATLTKKCEFNVEYLVPDNYYYDPQRSFVGWVVDKIEKEDGSYVPFKELDRKLLQRGTNNTFTNLTTYPNSTVTLKALWTGLKYTIKYDANVPRGYELISTKPMADSEYVGAEQKPLNKNVYEVRGAKFIGWSTLSDATDFDFVDEQEVLGLARQHEQVITLYAVWERLKGIINFDLGVNPNSDEDPIPPIDVTGNDGQWIPRPGRRGLTNADGDNFLYYIIKSITPAGSTIPYELTDEEKLIKIDPNLPEEIAAGSMIRNDGDNVQLIKIYETPYSVIVNTNVPASLDDRENVVVPNGYTQEIYVNDRERLELPDFSMEGYRLTNYIADDGSNREFKKDEIVEKLCPIKGGVYRIKLLWTGNTYKIVFDKGANNAIEDPKVVFPESNSYGVQYILPSITCKLENNKIDYLKVTKIIKEDGTEATEFRAATVSIPPENDTSGKLYYYSNLSTFSNSIVTLTAIWLKDNVNVIYNPGHDGLGPTNIDEADNITVAHPDKIGIYNNGGKPFKYWIIATMHTIPKEGEEPQPVPFSDEKKLLKIKPGTLLSEVADLNDIQLELLAIYDEPYNINILGNAPAGVGTTNPPNKVVTVDVNDRIRLPKDEMTLSGYALNGYAEEPNGSVIYKEYEIVERLCGEQGQTKTLYGSWSALAYRVIFESTDTGVSIVGDIATVNAAYNTEYTIPADKYSRRGYNLASWKVSKIVLADGTQLSKEQIGDIGLEISGTAPNRTITFKNLTSYENAVVTLSPVWKGLPYTITLDAQNNGKTATGATQSVIVATHGEAFNLTQTFTPNSSNVYVKSYNTQTSGGGINFPIQNYPNGLIQYAIEKELAAGRTYSGETDRIFLYAIWDRTSSGDSGNSSNSGNSRNSSGGTGGRSSGIANTAVGQPNVQGPLTDQKLYNQGTWVYRDTIDKWQYAANINNIFTNNNDFFNSGHTYSINNYSFETDGSVQYLADGFYRIGWNDTEHIFEFDKDGFMKTGFTEANGNIYYLLNTTLNQGAMAKGTVNVNGVLYNFDNNTGALVTDAETVEKKAGGMWIYEPGIDKWKYQTNAHGGDQPKFLAGDMYRIYGQDSEDYFMFDGNGYMMTGNVSYKGQNYYMLEAGGRRGALSYDKDTTGRVSYLFNQQGILVAQVNEASNATGWIQNTQTDGWQYLERSIDGRVLPLTNTYRRLETNGGYYDYIFDSKGNMQTGLTQFNGNIYYLEEKGPHIGTVQIGEQIINGEKYIFGSDGTLRSKNGIVYNYGLPIS